VANRVAEAAGARRVDRETGAHGLAPDVKGSARMDEGSTQARGPSLADPADAEAGGPPMPVRAILEHEVEAGLREHDRPARGLLLSGLSAGLDIGFGPMLMAVVLTLSQEQSELTQRLLAANAYAVGFVFVVLGRSELFTEHTTVAVFPVLQGRATYRSLARLWGLVYVANVVGAVVSGAIGAFVLTALGVVDEAPLREMGRGMVDHPFWVIGTSAVLAGWLMGLLSWLSRTSRATISQLVVVWVVTATIGLGKLHHCIAGTVEVVMAMVAPAPEVGCLDLGRFLLWSTLGNALGGAFFVAILKLGHARAPSRREE
jgi:formate/nitrite transporter FocA (FNT family)